MAKREEQESQFETARAVETTTETGAGYDFSYTQNRELSWLRFDDRVLDEAYDETVPLFERLKFVAIFESNLDEFFMVRVGGLSDLATLKRQPRDNKSNLTPSEQVAAIRAALPPLMERAGRAFDDIEEALAAEGVHRLTAQTLSDEDKAFVASYFRETVSPIISPLVIDPRHPFPNLRGGGLYIVCSLESSDEEGLVGLIEVPPVLPRVVELPGVEPGLRYILLEDIISAHLADCFGRFTPLDRAVIRVTRNADIDPDGEGVEEEEDYRLHMKKILKKRLRLKPVRLVVNGELTKATRKVIRHSLGLTQAAVDYVEMPLDLGYVFAVEGRLSSELSRRLLFEPFTPQPDPDINPGLPMAEQVIAGDKLLFYPYESMASFLRLVHEAAFDDDCISIRITLYRVAKQSRLCESLIAAVENGKEVTVLMELRARFDEQNNIEWAERLDEAGCTVIYGSEGFKCHSKICLVTYRSGTKLTRLTLLGTGNFNEKTARIYSDFMLLTAHEGIGEDAAAFFRNLSLGNLRGTYRHLGVAPAGLKPLILEGLEREIARARAGEPAQVFFKLNSLTDREVIDKIAEASQAGVRVEMIVRGISCLLPGIPGKTENVEARSIVGRFLEHARVYGFGADADTLYLSSADMMTRNTEHRVEIAFPVLDPELRDQARAFMDVQLRDNVKARRLTPEGTWERIARAEGEEPFNAQEALMLVAERQARGSDELRDRIRQGTASSLIDRGDVRRALPVQEERPAADEVSAAAGKTEGETEKRLDDAPVDTAREETAEGESAGRDHEPADAGTRDATAADDAASSLDEAANKADAAQPEMPDGGGEASESTEAAGGTEARTAPVRDEARGANGAQDDAVKHVEATLIDEGRKGGSDGSGANAEERQAAATVTALVRRTPNRLMRGFALIGLGIRTIFGRGIKR